MPINPYAEPVPEEPRSPAQAPSTGAGEGPRRPRERDHAHAHAREEEPQPSGEGELRLFPGGELVPRPEPRPPATPEEAEPRSKWTDNVWFAEASKTVERALDGSVYSARPPALRDSHERLKRAAWANGIPALKIAGQVYGYAALSIRAVLLAVCWLLDHPTRLLVAGAVAVAAIAPFIT